MILRETMAVGLVGVITGLPLAFVVGRLLESQLFGLSPHDARTTGVAVCTILFVIAMAGTLPALRASRVDPMTALRDE